MLTCRSRALSSSAEAPREEEAHPPRLPSQGLLFHPIHPSSLAAFRVAFGLAMCAQTMHFEGMYEELAQSKLVLPYPGLDLTPLVSPAIGLWILTINKAAALLTVVGFATRAATAVLCLSFGYLFLNCIRFHNNHYILVCHLTFLATFTRWGAWGSVDFVIARMRARLAKREFPPVTIPYWQLLSFQLLFCVPYAFGALAKLNEDWLLRAQPLKVWLHPTRLQDCVLPAFLKESWWFPWAIAWGGFLFDGAIVPLLFSRHLQYPLAFPGVLFFNGMNKLIFNIGIFPYAMLSSLLLFLPPCFLARLLRWALGGPLRAPIDGYRAPSWHHYCFFPLPPPHHAETAGRLEHVERGLGHGATKVWRDGWTEGRHKVVVGEGRVGCRQRLLLLWLGCFFCFHLLYPLRRLILYPPGVSWHEEGHLGAWHMKLRSKHGWVVLVAEQATELTPFNASCGCPLSVIQSYALSGFHLLILLVVRVVSFSHPHCLLILCS